MRAAACCSLLSTPRRVRRSSTLLWWMIKFLLAQNSAKQKGSRFPAPFLLRAGAEGKQRRRRCTNATPIFFPEKENGRRPSKRKAFPIASEQLEELQCLPIALPCARRCRGWRCYTIWLAPIIRCRSAHLVEVQPNFRLLPVPTMRRAQQCCIWHAVCRQANVTRASR